MPCTSLISCSQIYLYFYFDIYFGRFEDYLHACPRGNVIYFQVFYVPSSHYNAEYI